MLYLVFGDMNILVVHEVDYIRKPVMDLHWISEGLSLLGHNVYVLYYESLWGLNGWETARRTFANRALPAAKVELVCPYFVKMPVISRLSAFATHHFEIKKVIKENKIDAIILYSVPTNGLQTIYWARRFNIPVVFRSIDILNRLVPYRSLRLATKLLERKVYSSVDRILAITPKLCDYAVRLGAERGRTQVLPVPVDTDLFQPMDDDIELRHRWGLSEGDRIVLYMGTLFNFSGLDSFLPLFYAIALRIPKAKLVIVGDGEQRDKLEQIMKAYGLQKQVVITGFQPYRDIPKYINMADACINPFVINDTTRDIFPGKTVQMLACGKPIVMRPIEGVKAMILGEKQGVVYANTDGQMVVEVLSLLNSEERRSKIGVNGLKYIQQHHDYKKISKRLEIELESLIKERRVSCR